MSISAAPAQGATCGEFKNIYYDCTQLPWDATDGWTRTSEFGSVTARDCTPEDACVSVGVLDIDSNDAVLFWRMEDGLLTERYASATFRMKQTVSERNPQPDTTLFGGGSVWIDDGVKTTAVGFVEDLNGDRLLLIPIEGHPDPETGELNITEVLLTYFDWSAWHEYRLVKDAEGMIELFADGDPTPVVSFPYASLNMGSLGGPVFMFGNLIDGQVARVVSELDYFNYSVGMPSNDGKMWILYVFSENKVFNPEYEMNELAARVQLVPVEGLASNTQSHKFYLRFVKSVSDAFGNPVRFTFDQVQIGPAGTGRIPAYVWADAKSMWDGRDSSGVVAPDGLYPFTAVLSLVKVDKKGSEKTLTSAPLAGVVTLAAAVNAPRFYKNREASKFMTFGDWIDNTNINWYYRTTGCSTGTDAILDVMYDFKNPGTGFRYTKVASGIAKTSCSYKVLPGRPFYVLYWVCETATQVSFKPAETAGVAGVVRAKSASTGGTCKVERRKGETGTWDQLTTSGSVGGYRIDWGWNVGDAFQTTILNAGSDTLMLLSDTQTGEFKMLTAADGYPAYDDNGGVGASSLVKAAGAKSAGLVYVGQKPFGSAALPLDATAKFNVFRNDFTSDIDGDGLGNDLEDGPNGLGTCKSNTGWTRNGTIDCTKALSGGKDTDGDGLKDDWEVFGKRYTDTLVINPPPTGVLNPKLTYDLQFPAMGVNPVAKDILVQVDDWSKTSGGVDPFGGLNKLVLGVALERIREAFGRTISSQAKSKDPVNIIFDYGQTAFQFRKGGHVVDHQTDFCTQREIPEPCCNRNANRQCAKVWSQCIPANCAPGVAGVCCPPGVAGVCTNLFRTGYNPTAQYCVETAVPVAGTDRTTDCIHNSSGAVDPCLLYDAAQPMNNVTPNYDPHHPFNENEFMTGGPSERYLLSPERRHIFRELSITRPWDAAGYADYGNVDPIDAINPTAKYYPAGLVTVPLRVTTDPGALAALRDARTRAHTHSRTRWGFRRTEFQTQLHQRHELYVLRKAG
ncbi:MAG: hypothetical protein HY975_04120 [Candidatus Kerfeldbacteria bacterium]|nr:hypothetical protein [Candidatus Kerfeldbacteria bacterium]